MKTFLLTLIFTFTFMGTATAKIAPEILKPYKAYRAALEAGDKGEAFEAAKKAWEASEKLLGDSKLTGDLAANFAGTSPKDSDAPIKTYEKRMDAHSRAIELAHFYGDLAPEVELERHLNRVELGLSLVRRAFGNSREGGKSIYFREMEKALDKYNLRGSTFEGDMEVLRVRYYELQGKPEKGLEAANKAENIYANRTDNIVTYYPVMLKLFKGNVLKDSGQLLKAALEYQDVMQNLEGTLPADHVFVSRAFTGWVRARSNLIETGRIKEAEAAGLCKCWPLEEYKEDVLPLERIPPIMPRLANRSGHVDVVFDVDGNGKPINVRVLDSTQSLFEDPAIESIKKWQYAPLGLGEGEAKIRRDITSKITFRLTDEFGNIIPEPH